MGDYGQALSQPKDSEEQGHCGVGIHIRDKILAGWSEIMKAFMTPAKHMYVGLIHRLPIQGLGSYELQRGEAC